MEIDLEEVSKQLNKLNDPEERLDVLEKALVQTLARLGDVRVPLILGNTQNSTKKTKNDIKGPCVQDIHDIAAVHGLELKLAEWLANTTLNGLLPGEDTWSSPLSTLPCANVQPLLHEKCPEAGTKLCSGCRLVAYCSSVCQKLHWTVHKRDCKHILNSDDWVPVWIREQRDPVFTKPSGPKAELRTRDALKRPGLGNSIWGNVPAIDLLNIEKNEGLSYKKDLSFAFPASGDLRNVVHTINSVPAGHPGKIFVAINDLDPFITARNILLLLAISGIKNKDLAADIMLHLWYSTFIPREYSNRIPAFSQAALSTVSSTGRIDWKGDGRLRIVADISEPSAKLLMAYLTTTEALDPDLASQEYLGGMFAPNRVDYHDRYRCKLKPAHRLAVREFRNHGLVLPFGAANSHFNTPNATLFTPTGKWLQDDMHTPLQGWKISDVIAAGKSHGTTEADIFGCLYFYLKKQLVKFKEQLSTLDITFYLANGDCRDLATRIKSPNKGSQENAGQKLYPSEFPIKFDRIDLSNTADDDYVGYERSLADWGPLLNASNPCSTLLTYSMNWVRVCKGANPEDTNNVSRRLSDKFFQERLVGMKSGKTTLSDISPTKMSMLMMKCHAALPVMYENSKIFNDYLQKRSVQKAAFDQGLRVNSRHTITPQRHGIALDSAPSELPNFQTDDIWYLEVYLSEYSFYNRFQEFRRIK